MPNSQTLSSGLEDYIEQIYIAQQNDTLLKGADLARKLNISRASVSEALGRLVSKGLVLYSSYGSITLTDTGITLAKSVYNKHFILKNFFESVLDIAPAEAGENACKIEHIISPHVLDSIHRFTDFCRNRPDIVSDFRKGYPKQ